MRKITAVALAAAGLLMAGGAQALTIDIGGEDVPGVDPGAGGGNPPNIISFTNADSGPVTSIDFDLSYTSSSPSWGSEFFISVTHVASGTSVSAGTIGESCDDFGPCDVDLGFGNATGTFTAAFSIAVAIADGSGAWEIWLGDSFDDSTPEPDGVMDFGSSVTINQASQIPVPAAVWLFGSALAGLGFVRRRTS